MRHFQTYPTCFLLWSLLGGCAPSFAAFVPTQPASTTTPSSSSSRTVNPTNGNFDFELSTSHTKDHNGRDPRERSYMLTPEEVKPIIRLGKGDKEKVINAFGLWCAAASLVTCPIWSAAMMLVFMINEINPDWDPDRAAYDATGKVWAKAWLTLTNSFPTFSGDVSRIKESRGPCLFVANHASWLDIPVLCTVLDPVFKFIAKGELRNVPCIGQQLAGVSPTT